MTNGQDSAFRDGVSSGLTKREYFAAMALEGIMASNNLRLYTVTEQARYTVECADFLIEALNNDAKTS